jgi:dipeptidyl aminopeptidase/acylaminoacyl peptidase
VHLLFSWVLTPPGIYIGRFGDSDLPRRIVDADAGLFASPGHLLFIRQGTLFAQRFNPRRMQLEGSPTAVADHIVAGGTSGLVALSTSAAGRIAYRAGSSSLSSQFVWYDRSGTPLEPVAGSEFAATLNSSLSPDGQYLASIRPAFEGSTDIWVLDVRRGRLTRLTADPKFDMMPVWSPDGSRIAFTSNRNGDFDTFVKSADGTGSEELLAGGENGPPSDWSADGRFILLARQLPGNRDIWAVPLGGDRKPFPVIETTFLESNGQFSPDGRWIAFESNESGPDQIYVQPFPGPGRRSLISSDGGVQPRWRRDGQELFYLTPDNRLMAVPIRLDSKKGTVEADRPVSLFTPPLVTAASTRHLARLYMVSQDGKRFLMQTWKEVTIPITVIVNWKPKT